MSAPDLSETIGAWARRVPSVRALVLIGSRLKDCSDPLSGPTSSSDWDLQIFPSRPGLFRRADWLAAAGHPRVAGYVVRKPLWGGGFKVNLLLHDIQADLMIIPSVRMRMLKVAMAMGAHRRSGATRRWLQTFAGIIRPGWRFLKGAPWLEPLYDRVVAELPDHRLSDADVRQLAAGFVCDYLWTVRKIESGELLAAQRMLHLGLAEANFQLLHEFKLRRGATSFERARRIEKVATRQELKAVTVSAFCEGPSLRMAADCAAATCDSLVSSLLGEPSGCPAGAACSCRCQTP